MMSSRVYMSFLRLACFCIIVFLGCEFGAIGQEQSVRRWYLILHDLSSPFESRDQRANKRLYSYLNDLFQNKIPESSNSNTILLESERNNNIIFFDSLRDNISMYFFGLTSTKKGRLDRRNKNSDEAQYKEFIDQFLSQPIQDWQSWKTLNPGSDFEEFFQEFKSNRPSWGNGYSLSEFAYPGAITAMPEGYFDEIIVVLLSDYLSGSTFGNKQDEEILRQSVFRNYKPAASQIITSHHLLKGQFYKIDYFDFAVRTSEIDDAANPIFHGIKAFKVKPLAGSTSLDNATINIDSELKIYQKAFQKPDYLLSGTTINFRHNKKLSVERIGVSIRSAGDVIVEKTLAELDSESGLLQNYLNEPVAFNSQKNHYLLPEVQLRLTGILNSQNLEEFAPELVFTFYGRYEAGKNSVPVLYETTRSLNAQIFSFDNDRLYRFVTEWLPLILLLVLVIWIINKGKPGNIQFEIEPFNDSYEVIDYYGIGRVKTPYVPMSDSLIRVKVSVWFSYSKSLVKWRTPIRIKLGANHAEGLDVYLLLQEEDGEKHIPQGLTYQTVGLKPSYNKPLTLMLEIVKNDFLSQIEEASFIKLAIEGSFRAQRLGFLKSKGSTKTDFSFHIGPKLSNVWVGLDPGTTGTCISAGSHYSDLTISKTPEGNDHIMPSLVAFDKTEHLNGTDWNALVSPIVTFGDEVKPIAGLSTYATYRSVKKLIGYKNKERITFEDGKVLSLSGSQITSLLVKEVIRQFANELESNADKHSSLLSNYRFKPSKAVVAVPNNFTAAKTQAMVDSMKELGAFAEVRAIPEAEAVFIYYIFNRVHLTKEVFKDEKILIFDMGGATINTSLMSAYAHQPSEGDKRYEITVEGKVGYGVGGDSIDYCILHYLYSLLSQHLQLSKKRIDFKTLDNKTKSGLSNYAQEFKIELIRRYTKSGDQAALFKSYEVIEYLETLYKLLSTNGRGKKIDIEDEAYEALENTFNAAHSDSFFKSSILKKTIYNNVKSAVADTIQAQVSPEIPIDTIIYSGRSTLFPGVKELVKGVLHKAGYDCNEVILKPDELKTAVAKGACLYGMNNNAIGIDNSRTNGHFGILKTVDAGVEDFNNLIEMGTPFEGDSIEAKKKISSTFNLDANQVRFLQVMGVDPQKILNKSEKHKYSTLARIDVSTRTDTVGMSVSQNDQIICKVRDANDNIQEVRAMVSDEEITDANDEHYTWLI